MYLRNLWHVLCTAVRHPGSFAKIVKNIPTMNEAHMYANNYCCEHHSHKEAPVLDNPLWDYFQQKKTGNGIWKWEHYFDIYHRHLKRFIGQKVSILEVGVYSGGSLEMWRSYLGDESHIYGVDIEPSCKSYENEYTSIFIGDQQDRGFWQHLKKQVAGVDIVIDDGGHMPEQQRVTLEELLPFINPGGIFVCEDVHGRFNRFSAFAACLASDLHCKATKSPFCGEVSSFQKSIAAVHFYPYMVVIEKKQSPQQAFTSHKHGEKWQPFL
ncbi:putative methyltransferase [Candidatus Uabimicrobium amorphum]|uniref:Putative methyltransferase n=2 Tax=Uabimicrobium amorphum TaxID=2596890 RepID=A0A5S9ILA5_UABAM|nr:putative methyltransferase [Candidatus Uabimicrobium amorphum]